MVDASLATLLSDISRLLLTAALVAFAWMLVLVVKSVRDFTRTGPRIREEIQRHYRWYGVSALLRLAFWTFAVSWFLGIAGAMSYHWFVVALGWFSYLWLSVIASFAAIIMISALQFCRHLLYMPGSIVTSSHYRMTRFIPLWHWLTPERIGYAQSGLITVWLVLALAAVVSLLLRQAWGGVAVEVLLLALISGLFFLATRYPEPKRQQCGPVDKSRPNIVMIGSDTLRADRLGILGNRRHLTPFIDSLAGNGMCYANCFVPVARTAPSLVSYMTGAWPQQHGIHDNFVGDRETALGMPALPELLAQVGYRTAVISDWAGSDYGKFPFGFEHIDLPPDQWNLRYLIRQGPKDIRLFLSLFTHNRFGETCLPELYYLAGVPMGRHMTYKARQYIGKRAADAQPFFLNLFMATTHQPFGSEYPYYRMYSDPEYDGESKFAMSRLTEPMEIIRSQQQSREAFDLQQVMDLYDGAVRYFDDQVRNVVEYMDQCGLKDNTILVIYSDHGMEFFENDTWGQGNSVYSEYSNRVPLVLSGPGISGKMVEENIIRSVDLAPTLLELAGVQKPASMCGVSLPVNGDAVPGDLPAYCETGLWLAPPPNQMPGHIVYPDLLEILEVLDKRSGTLSVKDEFKDVVVRAKDRMIRTAHWKLICTPLQEGNRYSLYDMRDGANSDVDVAGQHPEMVRHLRELMENLGSHQ